MQDPTALLALGSSALAGIAITSFVLLSGWNGWLELRRIELSGGNGREPASPSSIARIEVADLKERVRKLEAIATGIER